MALVAFVSCLHLFIGLLLLSYGAQVTASGSLLASVVSYVPARAAVYIGSAALPFVLPGRRWSIIPQQIVLLFSATSAMIAITSGHFADGVIRPIPFIAADQSIYVLLFLYHMWCGWSNPRGHYSC